MILIFAFLLTSTTIRGYYTSIIGVGRNPEDVGEPMAAMRSKLKFHQYTSLNY